MKEISILMSIRPEWLCLILNLIKTEEIRRLFPKDYVGWVYIYCTKGKQNLYLPYEFDCFMNDEASKPYISKEPILDVDYLCNGKVVARFWCDKVEDIKYHFGYYDMGEWTESYILENACLTSKQLDNYLKASYEYDEKKPSKVYGYAIHISKLEVFNKPKELREFVIPCKIEGVIESGKYKGEKCLITSKILTKAPQNYCYVMEAIE